MGSGVLTLDTVLSATFFFAGKWTPTLKRNQSRDLLRHLLCRLHGASKGNLFRARIRASHANLGAELGLSREWTCKLGQRLQDSGWIQYRALRLPDGKFEVGVFSLGRQLKRLLCMLVGYRRPQHRVNGRSRSFPLLQTERDEVFSFIKQKVLARERQPPGSATIHRMPLLAAWLERGKAKD